jgi:hypothetical protein
MSITHLIDTILKPELESVFGPALTARILITARAKTNAPIVGMTKDHLEMILDAISMDDRVQGMWGNSGTIERIKRWKTAIDKVSAAAV